MTDKDIHLDKAHKRFIVHMHKQSYKIDCGSEMTMQEEIVFHVVNMQYKIPA